MENAPPDSPLIAVLRYDDNLQSQPMSLKILLKACSLSFIHYLIYENTYIKVTRKETKE